VEHVVSRGSKAVSKVAAKAALPRTASRSLKECILHSRYLFSGDQKDEISYDRG